MESEQSVGVVHDSKLTVLTQVLQRILSEDSELSELWEESDGGAEWKHSMEQLRLALGL